MQFNATQWNWVHKMHKMHTMYKMHKMHKMHKMRKIHNMHKTQKMHKMHNPLWAYNYSSSCYSCSRQFHCRVRILKHYMYSSKKCQTHLLRDVQPMLQEHSQKGIVAAYAAAAERARSRKPELPSYIDVPDAIWNKHRVC